MKDQVPVVLLNQWLEVEQEKSGFARRENWVANSDEYSVYSDSTISQALSVHGNSLRKLPKYSKRNSVLPGKETQKSVFEKLKNSSKNRRMTIMVRPPLLIK